MRPTLVQFGAGKIGRSFVGQLFARAGYQVVFVEMAPPLVEALNRDGRYRVVIKEAVEEEIWVEGVRAVDARDVPRVAEELAAADIAATAVGAQALESVYPLIAAGLLRRRELRRGPLDVLICENLRAGAEVFRAGLARHLSEDFDLESAVGLVETAVGKMVPLISEEVQRRDPLTVYAEAFNTLIVDRRAFTRPVPPVPGLEAKADIRAYVDRKLFIHNLGHSAAAWMGFVAHPDWPLLWQVPEDARVIAVARGAMWESALALIRAHPDEFDPANQREHIEDLLRRFRNRALGDTVERVGRHLRRKLAPDERVMGALRLQLRWGIEPVATIGALAAALLFHSTESTNGPDSDPGFERLVAELGPRAALHDVCALDPRASADAEIIERTAELYERLRDAAQREAALTDLAARCRDALPGR